MDDLGRSLNSDGQVRCYLCEIRSRLEAVKCVARMVKRHLEGIFTAVVSSATNVRGDAVNAHLQTLTRMACALRNPKRFRNVLPFHLGGLDLYRNAAQLQSASTPFNEAPETSGRSTRVDRRLR